MMKKYAAVLGLASVLGLSGAAQARELTLSTELKNYNGNEAYLAFYLIDADGQYQSTLWVAGKKAKYYKHLRDWARGSGLSPSEYDGISGASATGGSTLSVTVQVDDALLDAGYQIRVDSAVEDQRDNRAEVTVPLTTAGAGQPVAGRGYIRSFKYDF
jgi:hypothetical protein